MRCPPLAFLIGLVTLLAACAPPSTSTLPRGAVAAPPATTPPTEKGSITMTPLTDSQQVQDAGRRSALERSGFSAAAKLAPRDGKPFRFGAAYWLEAGALLSPAERAALAPLARHDLSPIAPMTAEQVGFFWDGWLGQFLVVLPRAGVVAVRQRIQPPGAGETTDSEVRVKGFSNLVRLASTP